RTVQGEVGDARRQLLDELAVAGLDRFGGDRQRAANVVYDRQAGALERGDRTAVALRVGREANLAGQDRNEPVIVPQPDMALEQLGQHSRRHMGVDMRRVDPGRPRPLDLRAQLGFRGLWHQMPAQACDIAPKETIIIDQPGCPADRRNRRPAIVLPFAGQGQVHAEIERRIRGSGLGDFTEPRARHHDRAAGDKAAPGEIEKTAICAVAHPDIVDMKDRGAFDAEGVGELHTAKASTTEWGCNLAEPNSSVRRSPPWRRRVFDAISPAMCSVSPGSVRRGTPPQSPGRSESFGSPGAVRTRRSGGGPSAYSPL